MKIIARIKTDFKEKFGIPRQASLVPELTGRVYFEPPYRNKDACRGLDGFSHIWLLWEFSETKREGFAASVRPPKLGGNSHLGVFATRSPYRPNPIGLSCVRLLGIEETAEGPVLVIGGADLLDGTPIFDIKPYIPYADCHPEAAEGFSAKTKEQKIPVNFPEELLLLVREEKREALLRVLSLDPRPSYRGKDPKRVYGMRFAEYDVKFTANDAGLLVTGIEEIGG